MKFVAVPAEPSGKALLVEVAFKDLLAEKDDITKLTYKIFTHNQIFDNCALKGSTTDKGHNVLIATLFCCQRYPAF